MQVVFKLLIQILLLVIPKNCNIEIPQSLKYSLGKTPQTSYKKTIRFSMSVKAAISVYLITDLITPRFEAESNFLVSGHATYNFTQAQNTFTPLDFLPTNQDMSFLNPFSLRPAYLAVQHCHIEVSVTVLWNY